MGQFEVEAPYGSVPAMSREAGCGGILAAPASSTVPLQRFASATAHPVIEQESATAQQLDVPWLVIVHNDPVNLMSYVTMVFQKVFGFTREKAEKHMLEVHQEGRSVVWSGMRERAELYVQQLHGYLLLATMERVS